MNIGDSVINPEEITGIHKWHNGCALALEIYINEKMTYRISVSSYARLQLPDGEFYSSREEYDKILEILKDDHED